MNGRGRGISLVKACPVYRQPVCSVDKELPTLDEKPPVQERLAY